MRFHAVRRSVLLAVVALCAAIGMPSPVLGVSTLDQQQTTYDGFSGNSTMCIGQTFRAGISGPLDHVSIYVRKLTDHPIMRIELRDAPGGIPGSTVLATVDIPGTAIGSSFGWVDAVFPTPADVVAGTTYAMMAPPLGPMGPDPVPWGFEWGGASAVPTDHYANGLFFSGASGCDGPVGPASSDLAFKTYVGFDAIYGTDGLIRRDFRPWVGNNVYNSTATGQSVSASVRRGDWQLFRIRVQNEGNARDKFAFHASGTAVSGFRVKFMRGVTDITAAVNAGTYRSYSLPAGRVFSIEAWVKVRSDAALGSQIERLVTISSINDGSKVDSVKFTLNRR